MECGLDGYAKERWPKLWIRRREVDDALISSLD